MKTIFLFFAIGIFVSLPAMSQETIRLKGKIVADTLEESTIHVINKTKKTGTLNSSEGNFSIEVRENDVLLFSSIQFLNQEVTISAEIFEKGYLEVILTEDVNELAEVNISNISLTGNLNTDIGNLEIVKDLPLSVNYGDIMNSRFEADINDPQSAPDNLAFRNNQISTGAGSLNILGGLDLLGNLLGLKGNKQTAVYTGRPVPTSSQIRKLFDDEFFKTSLGIQEEYIGDFLFYLDEQGITSQMLKDRNRLALIELLIDHGENYNAQHRGIIKE